MAVIKPFAGIRPAKEKAAAIAALPYDVYNTQEARKEVEKHRLSFLRIDRAETQFEEGTDPHDPKVYQKAHDLLWQMADQGDFITEDRKCYYVYELTMDGRVQTGLAACASIDDYADNVIKKHENTREEKEQDRIRHVDACDAQTGPIFLAYRSKEEINEIIAKSKEQTPLYDFASEDGIRHRVFKIAGEEDIADMEQAFAGIQEIYIADGHHRAASAVKVGFQRRKAHPHYTGEEEFNYFLSVLFPDDQLMIMDYNRAVRDLNGLEEEAFLAEVGRRFEVEKNDAQVKQPKEKGTFSMYLNRQWYTCTIREADKSKDPVKGLDVSILQDKLLDPVLGIKDPRTDGRIDFIGGIRGMEELERRVAEDCKVAFAMYPTSILELFNVADAGMLMPPKSTWFEPKLRSGLFIHRI